MPNDELLLKFMTHSQNRLKGMLDRASNMKKKQSKFGDIVQELESLVEGSKCHFYGTRQMQLGHENSHLNIFFDVDDAYFATQNPEKTAELIKHLMEYFTLELKKNKQNKHDPDIAPSILWKEPLKTLKTPVPTLRICSRIQNIQCDITFSSGLGVENTKLMHHLFNLQPEAHKLYHFARIWIHIDEFSFKRYVVALLVVFFLQTRNLMPSVLKLQEDEPETFIDGWNVSISKTKKLKDFGMEHIIDYKDYLIPFFEFYNEFDFSSNVICPYLGRAVHINNYPKRDEDIMKYKDNIRSFNKTFVNIADPLNLNFNVAYGVGKKRAKKFNAFCGHAIVLLEENMS